MSNMSGIPDNKAFRVSAAPGELYSFIRAKLDLSGQLANNNILYFNAENLLAYQNTSVFAYPNPNAYPKYHKIDENVLIGEVVASSSPDLVYAGGEGEVYISGSGLIAVSRNGSNVATLILSAPASGLVVGEYISVSGLTNAGFNTSAPTPILSIAAASTAASGAEIVSVARAAGVATLTLNAAASSFGFVIGKYVTISGITNDSNSFNTSGPVALTGVSGTTITYASTGGTATVVTEAATGASKAIAFPPRLTYANSGSTVTEAAAAGANRQVMTPILLQIGGAYKPSSGSLSMDLWAGPAGNEPAPLTLLQLEHAQVCYYGSEPADPAADPVLGKRKFLAVKLTGGNASNKITKGTVSVLIKLYPKFW